MFMSLTGFIKKILILNTVRCLDYLLKIINDITLKDDKA